MIDDLKFSTAASTFLTPFGKNYSLLIHSKSYGTFPDLCNALFSTEGCGLFTLTNPATVLQILKRLNAADLADHR